MSHSEVVNYNHAIFVSDLLQSYSESYDFFQANDHFHIPINQKEGEGACIQVRMYMLGSTVMWDFSDICKYDTK